MPSVKAQYELRALLRQREVCMERGLSPYPTMEESWRSFSGLQAGLDQALDLLDLLKEYPEMAPHINPGGLPDEDA